MAEKTRMTPEWIRRVWADNPCTVLSNGNVRTGPVRLGFVNILQRPKPGADGKERAYGAVLLFPDLALIGGQAALAPLQQAVIAQFKENAPVALQNQAMLSKYHNPFKKQDTFVDLSTGEIYDGFAEGRICISANSSQSQPGCFDINQAPITDKSRCYSGAWAIAALRPDWINRDEKKGPTFYLQSVMVVADDENLGGAGPSNPSVDFGGVKIDPTVNPAGMFGDTGHTAGGPAAEPAIDLFA